MFFSIIVVSLNAGGKLQKTYESIAAQTCGDYEIIIKDAGSSDGSLDFLEASADNKKVRVEISPDKGIYDGMNQAVRLAAGEYLYFLNCGDILYDKNTLEEVRSFILNDRERNTLSVYYGDVTEQVSGQLAAAAPVMNDFALFRNIPNHQAIFYDRRLLIGENGREYDTSYKVRADYEHFLWCNYEAHARMLNMKMTIASYEGEGYSEEKRNVQVSAAEHKEITRKYMPAGKRVLYRLYLIASLQPLRQKLSRSRLTAGIYQKIKTGIYHR